MKRLIDKLEDIRDYLYDMVNEDEDHIDKTKEKYYWIRLDSDQLNTVYNLIGDEIRELE